MTHFKAILFDLDGTLIDTTDLILHCFNHSWQTVCDRIHSRETLIATMGIPLKDAMRRLLATLDDLCLERIGEARTEDLIEQLLTEYRACNRANHDRLARPFNGVGDALSRLCRQGRKIGVVTSKSREFALRGLRLCSLFEVLDVIVCMEDTERHKPHPAPLHLALEQLHLAPHQAAYVGDSRHDMKAGRAAGVQTVAALWGPVPKSELEQEQPDFAAERPADLLEIFGS